MHIIFPYYHIELDLPAGTTVHEACRIAGHPLNTACAGTGICGKCLAVIRYNGITAQVLACQQLIMPEMAILISSNKCEEKLLTETAPMCSFQIDPLLRCYPVAADTLIEESKKKNQSVFETLKSWLPVSLAPLSCQMQHKLHHSVICKTPLINFLTIPYKEGTYEKTINIETGDHIPQLIGIAFDIGTTSIAAYLLDLEDGWLIDSKAMLNAQTAFSADVLGRVSYAKNNRQQFIELTHALWSTLRRLTESLCLKNQITSESIHTVTYCGNSIMMHFLMMNDPSLLGETPFLLSYKNTITWTGSNLSCSTFTEEQFTMPVSNGCVHFTLPGIGGLIGSDTTAVLVTLPSDEKKRLMIDLGTNCEIAVGKNETYTITSAACGPAFEGAGITMGMRSSTGAISSCTILNGKLSFEIIGDYGTPALGICGSGLVDIIGILLETGVILPDGCFSEQLSAPYQPLRDFFGTSETGERFFTLITPDKNNGNPAVILTQKDIRTVQLAIAAIKTAWQLLLSRESITYKELDAIVLSGAFGSSINLKNAKKIGLIPDFENVPVSFAGNGAGAGVQQVLLSRKALKKAEGISNNSIVINLADTEDFNSTFLNNLNFPDHSSFPEDSEKRHHNHQ